MTLISPGFVSGGDMARGHSARDSCGGAKPVLRVGLFATALALAGCGGTSTSAIPVAPSANTADAIATVGDVTIRASVLQTSTLDETIARNYGITRDRHTVMLLVAVRQGTAADATAVPARITATATDLSGRSQAIAMRELRSGDLLDYIGTVQTGLPDTLRFDIVVVRAGGATSSMRLVREFYPQ